MIPQQSTLNASCLSFLSRNGTQLENETSKEIFPLICLFKTHALRMILTYLLTPHSSSLLKLIGFQPVKKFPAFYGTRRFITAITSARHLSLSWAGPIQSIPPHPTSLRCVLILSYHLHLGLPNGLFPSGFPTKMPYTSLLSPNRGSCHAHVILDFITWTMLGEEYIALRRIPEQNKFVAKNMTNYVAFQRRVRAQHSNHRHRGKNYRIHKTSELNYHISQECVC